MSSNSLFQSVDDGDLSNRASFHEKGHEHARRTGGRSQRDIPSTKACAGQRGENHDKGAPGNEVEHEDFEMPRTSPRNIKKCQHSSAEVEATDLTSKDSQQPVAEHEERHESDSGESLSLNNDGQIPSATKKQLAWDASKSVSPGQVGSLISALYSGHTEATNASVGEGNVQEQEQRDEDSKAAGERWSYFNSYKTPSSFREYAYVHLLIQQQESDLLNEIPSRPKPSAPTQTLVGTSQREQMAPAHKSKYGAARPRNTLGGGDERDPKSKSGPFRITDNTYQPNKKQKVEGTPTSHTGSSASPINLVQEDSMDSNGQTRSHRPGSLQSQSSFQRKGRQDGVQEYLTVEKNVGFGGPKRKSKSSDSSDSNGSGRPLLLPPQWTVFKHLEPAPPDPGEDESDPIEDVEEVETRLYRHVKKDNSNTATLQVQIPASSNAHSSSRQKDQMRRKDNSKSTRETSTTSKYFREAGEREQNGRENGFPSADETYVPAKASSKLLEQNDSGSKLHKDSSRRPVAHHDPDTSLDELNVDQAHRTTANGLLGKRVDEKALTAKFNGTGSRQLSKTVDLSSDDELARNQANIKPTNFVAKKPAKSAEKQDYQIHLAFSEASKWLTDTSRGPWTLVHDPLTATLTVNDDSAQFKMRFPTKLIDQIEVNKESPKMVLHKSRDMTKSTGIRTYLELDSADDCVYLAEFLKSIHTTIKLSRKDCEHLDKVFARILNDPEPKTRKKSLEEDPLDVQLARTKSDQRHAAQRENVANTKATHHGQIFSSDERAGDPSASSSTARGTNRSMRSRSSTDHAEGGRPRSTKALEVEAADFYGDLAPRRGTRSSASEIRQSTRSSPRDPHPRLSPEVELPKWTDEHPEWKAQWRGTVVYPATGKHRARVDVGDIHRLNDGEFLNDNLILFYMIWLQVRLQEQNSEWAKRIYFQNTYFYQKLTSPVPGKKGINYDAVKRWTSKVDLLAYDYIVIPVCESNHWFLAIICNPAKLLPGADVPDDSQSQENGIAEDVPINLEIPEKTDVVELDDSAPADITSDLLEVPPPKTSGPKKLKRKSFPPKKYKPKEFRILTFDSLGNARALLCSNLKDYIRLEIKDKKDLDIDKPDRVGMTAKHIPQQSNFYDCGLFLLSYVEKFLEDPDKFISAILQSDPEVEKWTFPQPLALRDQIRGLLFGVSDDCIEKPTKGKSKGKQASKTDSAPTTDASSREVTKSARASPDGRSSDESRVAQENAIKPKTDPRTKEKLSNTHQPTLAESGVGMSHGIKESPSAVNGDVPEHVPRVSQNGLMSKGANFISNLFGLDSNKAPLPERGLKRPKAEVIDISESPKESAAKTKRLRSQDVYMQGSSGSSAEHNAAPPLHGHSHTNGGSKPDVPEAGQRRKVQKHAHVSVSTSKKRSISDISEGIDNRPISADDAAMRKNQPKRNHVDLRSPSPDAGLLSTPSHAGVAEHQSNPTSPDSELHTAKKRRSSPRNEKPRDIRNLRESKSSVGEDEDEMQLIDAHTGTTDNVNEQADTGSADKEMLFDNRSPSPQFLSSQTNGGSVSVPNPKRRRDQTRSPSSKPDQKHELRDGAKTDPAIPRKRNNTAPDYQKLQKPAAGRDAMDQAMIGGRNARAKHNGDKKKNFQVIDD